MDPEAPEIPTVHACMPCASVANAVAAYSNAGFGIYRFLRRRWNLSDPMLSSGLLFVQYLATDGELVWNSDLRRTASMHAGVWWLRGMEGEAQALVILPRPAEHKLSGTNGLGDLTPRDGPPCRLLGPSILQKRVAFRCVGGVLTALCTDMKKSDREHIASPTELQRRSSSEDVDLMHRITKKLTSLR
jgi:hypothetical protein